MITTIDLAGVDIITEGHEEILETCRAKDEEIYSNWDEKATDEDYDNHWPCYELIDTGWIETNDESVAIYVEGFEFSGVIFVYRNNEECEWWDKALVEAYAFTTYEDLDTILDPYWVG